MARYNAIEEMDSLRKNLLNTTLKNNNLLNYKPSMNRTLQITSTSAEALYDDLVLQDKKIKLGIKKEADSNILMTTDTAEAFEKKLIYINRQANSIREEQGYAVLYLAVGFLQWKDAENGKNPISPILLIPVELTRTGRSKVFYVKWTGEEPFTSMTLQMKMIEKHIVIPDFVMTEGKEGVKEYFKAVKGAIETEKEWKILNEIRLDLFDFKKFVMYKDIDPALWSQEELETSHPLIKKVFGIETDKYMVHGFKPSNMDTQIHYEDCYHVVDADSSQGAVIEDVKNGLCLVVQGPPGTGKSQTIVNTIADCIAHGKSVLFVCEKMAALKVVKERMDKIGLGELCLELHSDETKKKAVLESIEKSLATTSAVKAHADVVLCNIFHEKKALNVYAAALREPIGNVYPNFYTLYGIREDIRRIFCNKDTNEDIMPLYNLIEPENWTMQEWIDSKNAITMLVQWAESISMKDNVWYGCEPDFILPSETRFISQMVTETIGSLESLSFALDELSAVMNTNKLNTFTAMNIAMRKAAEPMNKANEFSRVKNDVRNTFNDEIFDIDFSEFEVLSNDLFKAIKSKYRSLKKNIMSCYLTKKQANDDEIVRDLKQVQLYKKLVKEVEYIEKTNETERLNRIKAINNVNEKHKCFSDKFLALSQKLGINVNVIFGVALDDIELSVLCAHMRKWANELKGDLDGLNSGSLTSWSQYLKYRNKCLSTKATYLLPDFENGKLNASDLWNIFEGNYVEALIAKNIRDKQVLNEFTKVAHENKITSFVNLDTLLLAKNRVRVLEIATDAMKKARIDPSNKVARSVLETEFNKKKRHMPIRKLMLESGELIKKIKPCFMMSPITVAQYLDPKGIDFDVIIFDEASQIKPEDAIGTLLRGKQLIVMGDPKQLPPTSFFESVIEDDNYDECDTGDMESILNLCKRNFITKTLSWHYRSRHESLIAVSNEEFYESALRVYPSPLQKDSELGLKFEYQPETIYERGVGVNREEAKMIAEAVFAHYKANPNKSLGVGAFNTKQQVAIQEEVDKLARKYSKIKIPDTGEYFFIKNLETIQGDERDVIFLSIGFGFDAQKKLSMNFGALNKEGGERRLNVLITRAREKCVIFANFRAQDLNPEGLTSNGLKCLRAFLEFAETREINITNEQTEKDRAFEESVYLYLKKKGFNVHRNIGCSGYKMNLAIVDPEHEGSYAIGIECDGENYFSSAVCRDRDRLRETMLINLGWKICCVWSTDWYLNPRKSRISLLHRIEQEMEAYRTKVNVKTQPEPLKVAIIAEIKQT